MRMIRESALSAALSALPVGEQGPRVVMTGNHAVPWEALRVLDGALPAYRLFMVNAPRGVPQRDGVVLESPFVGAGMRDAPGLRYLPARLSLVPALFATTCPPDVVVLHVSAPRDGTVSMGTEVNVLPAAVEAVRRGGGLVVAQVNPAMPWTYGDAELDVDLVDLCLDVEVPLPEAPVRPPPAVRADRAAGGGARPRRRNAPAGHRPPTRPSRRSSGAAACGCGRRWSATACSAS